MALKVIATINSTIKNDAITCFIEAGQIASGWQTKDSSIGRNPVSVPGGTSTWRSYLIPDQSSATRMESLGFDGSYFTLAGWPATRRSARTWLSNPVMSCAV